MATVDATVEVDLDQFEDHDILEAAADIIREHKRHIRPTDDPHGFLTRRWDLVNDALEKVANAIGATIIGGTEDESWAPPSTAATIRSMDALRAWQERQKGKSN